MKIKPLIDRILVLGVQKEKKDRVEDALNATRELI
jgi:hypothetical protein